MMDVSLSIVIPVYNSERSLAVVVRRVQQVLTAQNVPFEIILVNDGSRDHSWSLVQQLVAESDTVRGINLMRNYGQHNALLCGVRACRHEVTVTIDDDLQHPPEHILALVEHLQRGFDVVYGAPAQLQHGFLRDLASRLTKLSMQAALGAETARLVSGFRVFRTRLRDAFADYCGPYVNLDVLLTWASTRFAALPVEHQPRAYGTSNYTIAKLLRHAVNMMTGFSDLPLRLASGLGILFAVLGMLGLLALLAACFVPGWAIPASAFLMPSMAVFTGVQLFAIGIIGEYLARIHFRTMGHPTYAIMEMREPGNHPTDLSISPRKQFTPWNERSLLS